jgi:hypothetical protein
LPPPKVKTHLPLGALTAAFAGLRDDLRDLWADDFLIACREFFERDLVEGLLLKGFAMPSWMRGILNLRFGHDHFSKTGTYFSGFML